MRPDRSIGLLDSLLMFFCIRKLERTKITQIYKKVFLHEIENYFKLLVKKEVLSLFDCMNVLLLTFDYLVFFSFD